MRTPSRLYTHNIKTLATVLFKKRIFKRFWPIYKNCSKSEKIPAALSSEQTW